MEAPDAATALSTLLALQKENPSLSPHELAERCGTRKRLGCAPMPPARAAVPPAATNSRQWRLNPCKVIDSAHSKANIRFVPNSKLGPTVATDEDGAVYFNKDASVDDILALLRNALSQTATAGILECAPQSVKSAARHAQTAVVLAGLVEAWDAIAFKMHGYSGSAEERAVRTPEETQAAVAAARQSCVDAVNALFDLAT